MLQGYLYFSPFRFHHICFCVSDEQIVNISKELLFQFEFSFFWMKSYFKMNFSFRFISPNIHLIKRWLRLIKLKHLFIYFLWKLIILLYILFAEIRSNIKLKKDFLVLPALTWTSLDWMSPKVFSARQRYVCAWTSWL